MHAEHDPEGRAQVGVPGRLQLVGLTPEPTFYKNRDDGRYADFYFRMNLHDSLNVGWMDGLSLFT